MLPLFSHPESEYDKQIRRVLRDMEMIEPGSDQYDKLVERLQKLQKMRAEDRQKLLDPNAILPAAANLTGIWLILHYERFSVITTKALAILNRPR